LRHMVDSELERNVLLIWANKTERDVAFGDELEEMVTAMPALRVIHVMSNQDDWHGDKGYVDSELLRKYVSTIEDAQFFVCGPPVMMVKVIQALRELGVPKGRIHHERFALR
jgi:ferredoxin-NADP reductase